MRARGVGMCCWRLAALACRFRSGGQGRLERGETVWGLEKIGGSRRRWVCGGGSCWICWLCVDVGLARSRVLGLAGVITNTTRRTTERGGGLGESRVLVDGRSSDKIWTTWLPGSCLGKIGVLDGELWRRWGGWSRL